MEFDSAAIAKFCQKHHITRMLHYNHPSRHGACQRQVVDFVVDFAPGHMPGYFDMFGAPGLIGMEEELAGLLGKKQAFMQSSTGIPEGRKKALADSLKKGYTIYQDASAG